MALRREISIGRLVGRLRREAFLYGKSLRRRGSAPGRGPVTVFVAGVHRSGTNMLMEILEASYETDVFHETDERAFDGYLMRGPEVIRSLVRASRAPVVVVKALNEADKLAQLLDDFAPAKGLWMVRHFDDVVNSTLKRWPGFRNMIDEVTQDRDAAGWRGRGMTDDTHRTLRQHYRPDINQATAIALFWHYRNQLFFDQRLDCDSRVLTVEYEDLVRVPDANAARLAAFLEIRCSEKMKRISHSESVRKNPPPEIAPDVKALCETMYDRLTQQLVRLGSADRAAHV